MSMTTDTLRPSRANATILSACAVVLLTTVTGVLAQISPARESLSDVYPGRA